MDIDREALNRTRKAAVIAKTAIAAGVTPLFTHFLDDPAFRTGILAAIQKPNRASMWTEASEQTWAEAKVLVTVFGG